LEHLFTLWCKREAVVAVEVMTKVMDPMVKTARETIISSPEVDAVVKKN
jgi:hypothetical protein